MQQERHPDKPDVHHRGTLWAESFLGDPNVRFIVQSLKSDQDPHQLGWRFVPQARPISFLFSNMDYATAEGAVAVAAMAAAIRQEGGQLSLGYGAESAPWAAALGLSRIADDDPVIAQAEWCQFGDCHVYPLTHQTLTDTRQAASFLESAMASISIVPKGITGWETIAESVRRVLCESLLNVVEHAYPSEGPKQIFLCLTITPSTHGLFIPARAKHFLATQELEWLSEHAKRRNRIIEIAIADFGVGVPRTLFADAEERLVEFKTLVAGLSSGTNKYQQARALLHQCLCKYAFAHTSTRKRSTDFPSRAASLNWRGLHRCFHHSALQDGCLVLASGQGRAGYASIDGRIAEVDLSDRRGRDLPGTAIVLRLPLASKTTVVVPCSSSGIGQPAAALRVMGIAASHALRDKPDTRSFPIRSQPESVPVFVVLFPFCSMRDGTGGADFGELMTILRNAPCGVPVLLMFADIPHTLIRELRATVPVDDPSTVGLPRVLSAWRKDSDGLDWALVGHVPIPTVHEQLCLDIEKHGIAQLPADVPVAREIACELADVIPSLFSYDATQERLLAAWHSVALSTKQYASLLQQAFASHMHDLMRDPGATYVFGDGTAHYQSRTHATPCMYRASGSMAIRLPTGRLVRRFISTLSLLRSHPVLMKATGQLMGRLLQELYPAADNPCIVTDSPASYFVASLLLRDCTRPLMMYTTQNAPLDNLRETKARVTIFTDAMFRGETTARHVRMLRDKDIAVCGVMTGLDLRSADDRARSVDSTPISALLSLRFDPEVIDEAATGTCDEIIEVDQITHVPFRRAQKSPFVRLANTSAQEAFLDQHPEVFRHGFHNVGGRIHTVSLRSRWMVQHHAETVCDWLADVVEQLLLDLPESSRCGRIVLFRRLESAVGNVLGDVAKELIRRKGRIGCDSVGVATIPAAPSMATPRQVFALEEENLLADLEPEHGALFSPPIDDDFIAVYLDDAAVTANSLRDFVTKAAKLRQPAVRAILAVTLVNRLSPSENRFFATCRTLSDVATEASASPRGIAFRLGEVFRLQVKSTERETDPFLRAFVRQLDRDESSRPPFLTAYVRAVNDKLGEAQGLSSRPLETTIVQHPFYAVASPETRSTLRAIRIRHLLALHEQNEGVLSELLAEIHAAVQASDASLVSVLALEPYLLDNELFSVESWADIRKLCKTVIASSAHPSIKSDALFVLAREPRHLLTELRDVIGVILEDDELTNQLLSALYSARPRDAAWHASIQACVDAHREQLAAAKYYQVCDFLHVVDAMDALPVCNDLQSALNHLHSLIANTEVHTDNHDRWREMCMRMSLPTDAPSAHRVASRADVEAAIRYVRDSVVPAMTGLQFVARVRGDMSSVQRLQHSIWDAERMCSALRRILRERGEKELPIDDSLRETWRVLSGATLRVMAPVHFLGSAGPVADASTLEDIMPKYLCMPLTLLSSMAGSLVPDLQVKYAEPPWLVVSVDKSKLEKVLSLLFDNIVRYGVAGSCAATADTSVAGQAVVTLSNTSAPIRTKGAGHGIAHAKTLAQSAGFTLRTEHRQGAFTAELVFKDAFLVHPIASL